MSDITRDGSGRWLAGGKSPNPSGRPGMPAAVKEMLADATPRAVARLIELMDDEDPRVALVACREVLDRSLGKAPAAVTVTTEAEQPVDWGAVQQAMMSLTLQHLEAVHGSADARDLSEVPTAALDAVVRVGDAMRGRRRSI